LKEGLDLVVAGLYSRVGDLGRARVLAQAALDRSNDDLAAWALMAGVALGQRDTKMVDLCLREIRRLEKGRKFNGIVVEALQALDKGAAPQARTLFDEALRHRAKSVEVMERILRLDLLLGIREKTEDMARFLILLDSRNALAHYILGVIHLRANAWADARPWLEKSVALSPAPEALNDLAWVLLQQGELTLAEQRASEAVKRMPAFGAAWDTLGMTLIAAGRHDEAVKALERAIACGRSRSPTLLAHLARARLGQGNKPEALLLLQEAVSVKRALIPQEEEEIRAVRQCLKSK
jgi:tetratricopeptide (TPR) repeat protein